MKILLTGGSGFLGKNLLDYHLGRRSASFANSNLDRLRAGSQYGYEPVEIQLFLRGDKPESFVNWKPDIIIHLAAEIKDPAKMFESNVELTWRLLEAFKDVPYQSFIYVGSSSEYGRNDEPMKETDPANPATMYEGTKAAATMLCKGHAREYDKPVLIVRPFSIYGPHESEKRFVPTLIRAAWTGEKVKIYPGSHDWLYVEDFLAGLWLFANTMPFENGTIVNLGSGKESTNYQMCYAIQDVTGEDINYMGEPEFLRTYDALHWCADISLAKAYGWHPVHDIHEGLRRYVEPKPAGSKNS